MPERERPNPPSPDDTESPERRYRDVDLIATPEQRRRIIEALEDARNQTTELRDALTKARATLDRGDNVEGHLNYALTAVEISIHRIQRDLDEVNESKKNPNP